MRAELRDILLEACAKHGNVDVRWETKITAIREEIDGVVLALADGSELKGASRPARSSLTSRRSAVWH